MARGGNPTSASAPANPNPCSSPNAKATTHGALAVRPGLPVQAADDLGGDKHDAQRDDGFHRRLRHTHETERGGRQRHAVGQREGRDGHQQPAEIADDQHQRGDKQQMVHAFENVMDAKHEVGA